MTIQEVRAVLQRVTESQAGELTPGEALLLDALDSQLRTYGEDITDDILEAIRDSLLIVSAGADHAGIVDGLRYVDDALCDYRDERRAVPDVTIVARITVSADWADCKDAEELFRLIAGISDGAIAGDVSITVEEG